MTVLLLAPFILLISLYFMYEFSEIISENKINKLINSSNENCMYIIYLYGDFNIVKYEISPTFIKHFKLTNIIKSYKDIFKSVYNDDVIKIEICESEKYGSEKVIKTIYYNK